MLGALRATVCSITQNVHTANIHWVLIQSTCFITLSYHNYYFVLYILGIWTEFNYCSMQSCKKADLVIFGLRFSKISIWKYELIHQCLSIHCIFFYSIFNVCIARHNTNCRIRLANHILYKERRTRLQLNNSSCLLTKWETCDL